MDLGDCGPEAKLRPLIQALFIFCRGLHLLSPSSLGSIISSFLSLWSDMVPSFTLMPNSFSPTTPPSHPRQLLHQQDWASKKVLRVHGQAALSQLKVGRSLPEDYFSASWTFPTPPPPQFPDKETNVGRKEHRKKKKSLHLSPNQHSGRTRGLKEQLL